MSGLEALYTLWGDEVFSDPVFYALSIEERNELHLIATRSSIGSRRQDKAKELDSCSIPDDHIDPRRSAFFMARSILRDIRSGVRAC